MKFIYQLVQMVNLWIFSAIYSFDPQIHILQMIDSTFSLLFDFSLFILSIRLCTKLLRTLWYDYIITISIDFWMVWVFGCKFAQNFPKNKNQIEFNEYQIFYALLSDPVSFRSMYGGWIIQATYSPIFKFILTIWEENMLHVKKELTIIFSYVINNKPCAHITCAFLSLSLKTKTETSSRNFISLPENVKHIWWFFIWRLNLNIEQKHYVVCCYHILGK